MTTGTEPKLSTATKVPDGPADDIIKAIEQFMPHLKFYRKTMPRLLKQCHDAAMRRGMSDPEVIKVLKKLHALAVRLSTPGWALLLFVPTTKADISGIRADLKLLNAASTPVAPTAGSAPAASTAPATAIAPATETVGAGVDEKDEKLDEDEMSVVQDKLEKYRGSADKLFGEYKIRQDDLKRFVLPLDYLEWDKTSTPIAKDEISQTFSGKIVKGNHKNEVVHVKKLAEIEGGSTQDIIRRTIFLTHLLRSCENVVRPMFVVMPDLILLEPTSQTTLDHFKLRPEQKIDVALKIAGALALVHSFKIVHRDVRGGNVVMTSVTQADKSVVYVPKLTGFEVCRHIKYDYSLGSVVKRTVWHAPERVSWHGTSFKTDVFSFGVLMYEISMGGPPVMKGTNVVQSDVQQWVSQEYDHISPEYSNLMRDCLDIDYPKRPEMDDVLSRLEEIATGNITKPSATTENDQ